MTGRGLELEIEMVSGRLESQMKTCRLDVGVIMERNGDEGRWRTGETRARMSRSWRSGDSSGWLVIKEEGERGVCRVAEFRVRVHQN